MSDASSLSPSAHERRTAFAVLMVMPLFFSSNIIFGRAVADQVEPFTLAFIRWSLTALVLAPFVWRELASKRHHLQGQSSLQLLL
ncbi:MAG: hypothetical protein MJH08_16555, partial [Hyphomicrobiales bacterium]|nr:hypothetical protein [Hyphomicrobiales bacterium]